ncbi:MAG: FAD-binding oxidoreductase [Candidatus Nanopelagicales bacterium]|nr:FAD-binding oxidoreductase [Candidatus Nanopelagicales bacterium]
MISSRGSADDPPGTPHNSPGVDRGAADLPAGLRESLAEAGIPVVTDPALLAAHVVDWTGRWHGPAWGAVRPSTTEQVALVLRAARSAGVPVQVQGGNTGLVGGSVPDRPCLLLLTSGLHRIDPVDLVERTVVAGAGVTAARLADHARRAGLHLGVDLAARDSATVGGMVATNAGGVGVCAFGMMREQVRGLEAVLADGRIVSTVGRPRKDNCGYDLSALLAGSEGTLGVITAVEVTLHPALRPSTVALLAVPDLAEAVRCAREVPRAMLLAAEAVDSAGIARAAAVLGIADPLPPGAAWAVLLEVADGATAEGVAPVADRVVAVATDPAQRRALWALRERQTEVYATLPGVQKLDVSVRLADLDAAASAIQAVVASTRRPGRAPDPSAPTGRTDGGPPWAGIFGHVLDGNLHVQLVDADEALADRVLEVVVELGGSISAEHGIGRLKADRLHLARSPEQVAWMRAIKATVDPGGLLNPGVLVEPAPY